MLLMSPIKNNRNPNNIKNGLPSDLECLFVPIKHPNKVGVFIMDQFNLKVYENIQGVEIVHNVPKNVPTPLGEALEKVGGNELGGKERSVLLLLLEDTLNTFVSGKGMMMSRGHLYYQIVFKLN